MDIFKKLFGKGSSETLPYKPEAKVLSTEWAQELSPTLAPDVTLELVRIPAGEFLMGSDKIQDKLADDDETPKHKVVLAEYLIGKYPVTNAQYRAFVEAAGHRKPDHWKQGAIPPGKEQHPVVNISWDDAVAFCCWAGQASGRHVSLPGEDEWEKACRGVDGRIWPWGDQPPDNNRCNFGMNVGDTTAVGKYSPQGDSPYGCADMAGNVLEWTSRFYKGYPYDAKDGRDCLESRALRVLRGGSFDFDLDPAGCACGYWYYPYYRDIIGGFRVVVSPFQAQFSAPLF